MYSFVDLMERIDSLSKEEVVEIKKVVDQRWMAFQKAEILRDAREARQEYEAGKTYTAATPEQIKQWFIDTVSHAD